LLRYTPVIPDKLRELPRYKEIMKKYPPLKRLDE
jgi:hypothetical protein